MAGAVVGSVGRRTTVWRSTLAAPDPISTQQEEKQEVEEQ
jgi:hypothetical protein